MDAVGTIIADGPPHRSAYEPNSNDGEYSQPFLHIQYNRIASLRPIATLAMLLCRRIARCSTDVSKSGDVFSAKATMGSKVRRRMGNPSNHYLPSPFSCCHAGSLLLFETKGADLVKVIDHRVLCLNGMRRHAFDVMSQLFGLQTAKAHSIAAYIPFEHNDSLWIWWILRRPYRFACSIALPTLTPLAVTVYALVPWSAKEFRESRGGVIRPTLLCPKYVS